MQAPTAGCLKARRSHAICSHPVDVVQRPSAVLVPPVSAASGSLDAPLLQGTRITVSAAAAAAAGCAVTSRRRVASSRQAATAPDVETPKQRGVPQAGGGAAGEHNAPDASLPHLQQGHEPEEDVERRDLQRLLLTNQDQDLELGDDPHSHASQKGFASSALTSLKNVSKAVGKGASAAVLGAPADKESESTESSRKEEEGGWLKNALEALKLPSFSSHGKDEKKRRKRSDEEGGGVWEGLVNFTGAIASSIKKVPSLLFVDTGGDRKAPRPRKNPKDGSQAVEVALPGGEFLMEAAGKAQEVAQEAAGKAQEVAQGAAGVAQEAAGKAQEVAQEAAGVAQEAAGKAQEVAQEAAGKAQEVAQEALESMPGLPVAEEEASEGRKKKKKKTAKNDKGPPKVVVMKAEQNLVDSVELPPLPTAPGLETANFTVCTKVGLQNGKSKKGGAEGVDRLMCLPGGRILEIMCSSGWEVRRVNVEKGLYDIFLPDVKYAVPLGASVTIPPPHFAAFVNDLNRRNPKGHCERLIGDLVLQNGQDILTVELGFPFNKVIKVSAAGWTRAFIGWSEDKVLVECQVEIGMQLPRVPGLMQIMEFFVKAYAAESARDIACSLALGADTLMEEGAEEEEVALLEVEAVQAAGIETVSSPKAAVKEVKQAAPGALEEEVETASTASTVDTNADTAATEVPKGEADVASASEPKKKPEAPGMAESNLLVDIMGVKKTAKAKGGEAGLERLMQQSSLSILQHMTTGGWEVEEVKAEVFDLYLPAVTYEIGTATVSIPSPHFNTDVDRRRQLGLECDMVLQNGKDILTIKLGFPFYQTIKVSGAGWARAQLSIEEDKMAIETEVHVGLDVPGLPGLTQILEYFVRSYAEESVQDIAQRLASNAHDGELAQPSEDA